MQCRGDAARRGGVPVEIDPSLADIDPIYLRRQSVAPWQQQAIEQAHELQRSVLTDTWISTTDSAIRVQEAALVERFVSQVRAVRPEGRIVLAGADWRDMLLEDGDEIVIPKKSDVVVISGEVKLPQTVLWESRRSIRSYIEDAGGLSNRGDAGRILVLRNDGSVHDGSKPIRKGDHIIRRRPIRRPLPCSGTLSRSSIAWRFRPPSCLAPTDCDDESDMDDDRPDGDNRFRCRGEHIGVPERIVVLTWEQSPTCDIYLRDRLETPACRCIIDSGTRAPVSLNGAS